MPHSVAVLLLVLQTPCQQNRRPPMPVLSQGRWSAQSQRWLVLHARRAAAAEPLPIVRRPHARCPLCIRLVVRPRPHELLDSPAARRRGPQARCSRRAETCPWLMHDYCPRLTSSCQPAPRYDIVIHTSGKPPGCGHACPPLHCPPMPGWGATSAGGRHAVCSPGAGGPHRRCGLVFSWSSSAEGEMK